MKNSKIGKTNKIKNLAIDIGKKVRAIFGNIFGLFIIWFGYGLVIQDVIDNKFSKDFPEGFWNVFITAVAVLLPAIYLKVFEDRRQFREMTKLLDNIERKIKKQAFPEAFFNSLYEEKESFDQIEIKVRETRESSLNKFANWLLTKTARRAALKIYLDDKKLNNEFIKGATDHIGKAKKRFIVKEEYLGAVVGVGFVFSFFVGIISVILGITGHIPGISLEFNIRNLWIMVEMAAAGSFLCWIAYFFYVITKNAGWLKYPGIFASFLTYFAVMWFYVIPTLLGNP